jgi:Flp pilus assembly protein TadD
MTWAPWSPQPWRLLAEAQYVRGDLAASRRNLATALRKDPRDWQLWLDLAAASNGAARGRALAHALALNPRSPEIADFRATEMGGRR